MKLQAYLRKHKIRNVDFAAAVGVDDNTVWRWLNANHRPGWKALARIAQVTQGAVTADDFMIEGSKKRTPRPSVAA